MTFGNCIYWVVPSLHASNAGFRVRTRPIADTLEHSKIRVSIVTPDTLVTELKEIIKLNATVVFSKPSDSLAYLCVRYLVDNGIKVIADVFDNYFSWSPGFAAKRLYWNWLRILDNSTGVVASTPPLKSVIESLFGRTVQLAPDPFNALPIELEQEVLKKWKSPDCYECLWFGIQSNPYFIAGLDDLMSWTSVLTDLQIRVFPKKIRITLCTNPVAEVESTLAHLRCHGIEALFVPWSESACNEALASAHIVMIPTNLSEFSRGKTHNRCSDALTYRCAVLTNPHSPYQDIPGAIFTDTALLTRTLQNGVTDILPLLEMSQRFIHTQFNVSNAKLAFLNALEDAVEGPQKLKRANTRILVVGETNSATVRASRQLGYLSAAFSGIGSDLNFDFFYQGMTVCDRRMHCALTEKGIKDIIEKLRADSDTDWVAEGTVSTCKLANATLCFDTKKYTCDFEAPTLAVAANEIEQIRSLVNHIPSLKEYWFDINIAFLFDFFLLLGFSDIDFVSDGPGGWSPYAKRIAPRIGDLEQHLKQYWLTQTSAMTRQTLAGETYTWE